MCRMNKKMRHQVEEILLMPIYCDKNYTEIKRENNKILTSQKYFRKADENMSDFAIGFYEIIYSSILGSNGILTEDGKINNKEFTGDTMNSFNIIANKVPESGGSKKIELQKKNGQMFLEIIKSNTIV